MKLIQFEDWFYDEFKVQGFRLMTNEEYDDMCELFFEIHNLMETDEIPYISLEYGTNQNFEYKTTNDIFNCLEITDISERQAEDIAYFFGQEYGWFPLTAMKDWLHDKVIERDMLQ